MKVNVEATTRMMGGDSRAHTIRITGTVDKSPAIDLVCKTACEIGEGPDLARVAEVALAELEGAAREARNQLVALGLIARES